MNGDRITQSTWKRASECVYSFREYLWLHLASWNLLDFSLAENLRWSWMWQHATIWWKLSSYKRILFFFSPKNYSYNHQHVNPIKGDVSDSHLNAGGGRFDHPLEINEGAPWDPILLKVILKPIKFMITCKKSGPYLKNLPRYWNLKILILQNFAYLGLRKLPQLAQFLRYKGHLLDLVLFLLALKMMFSNLGSTSDS